MLITVLLLLGLFKPFIYRYLLFYRFMFRNLGFWHRFNRFPGRNCAFKMTFAFKRQFFSQREELTILAYFYATCLLANSNCSPLMIFTSYILKLLAIICGLFQHRAWAVVFLCILSFQVSYLEHSSTTNVLLNWLEIYISYYSILTFLKVKKKKNFKKDAVHAIRF